MSARIKRLREQEKVGSRKKSKATKTSLDPITLIEGELYEINDTVWDFTMETLQEFEKHYKILLMAIQTMLQEL